VSLLLAHCAITDRRAVLEALCEEAARPLPDLAEFVVARREDIEPSVVPDDAREGAIVSLYHNHLQQLADANLVDIDEPGDGVRVTLAPGLASERVQDLIAAGEGHWDTLGVLLGDPRRERVASLLTSADEGALPLGDLARAIAALERGEAGPLPEAAVESTRVSLHHVHLPKLEDAGLVDYDAEDGYVSLERLPNAYETVVDHATGDGYA